MRDILTVMWKERLMLFRYRGGRMRFVLTLLSPILLAFYVSWSTGLRWVYQPVAIVPTAMVVVLAVIIVIPESFAGERERRTLETLLSTRLTDGSILFGKLLIAVLFAMALAGVVLILGLVTVNLFHYRGVLLLYRPDVLVASLFVCLVFSVLVGSLGVIISLESDTVQEATQVIAGIILVPPMMLGMLVLVLEDEFAYLIMRAGKPAVGWTIIVVLSALAVFLVGFARSRFDRARMFER